MSLTRRTLLKGVLTLAACKSSSAIEPLAVDAGIDATAIKPPDRLDESALFPLGVWAGDVDGDRAVLWAHYTGTAALTAFVWDDHDVFGPIEADVVDGFVHLAVTGLVAGHRYRYAFVENGKRSRIGRFRAATADAEVLTFGAIACTEKGRSPAPLARASERTDLDGFLFCGDNAYCDGAETLAEYREEYRAHFGRAAHIALRAQNASYITWDDHEVKNDWNPETINKSQLDAAFGAFFDHAPVTRGRFWRSAKWGKTLEIFVLDCRSERKPSTIVSQNPQYISPEQLAWLKAGLAASTATFKLIMNSVPITNMPSVWDAYPTDRWEAYGKQRTDILKFIDDHVTGVLWLSGDFHLAFISNVSKTGPGANQREVLCGPGGQNSNVLVSSLQPPQFSFASGTNNYTTLRFDPTARSVTVKYIDGEGTEFHSESFVI